MFFHKAQTSICALFFAAILGGCGGSTQGTGGVTVEGRLLEVSGAPVNGAVVTVLTSGDSTLTDVNGAFVLGASGEQIELLFESGTTSAAASLAITPATRTVVATFTLDRERGEVEVDEFELREGDDDDGRDDNGDDDPIDDDDSSDDNGGDDDGSDDDDSSNDDGDDDGSGSEDDGADDDQGDDDSSDDDGAGDDNGGGSNSGGSGGGNSGGSGNSERREVRGALQSIGSNQVVVNGTQFVVTGATEYRDENGAVVTASYFTVGMEVKARGFESGGQLVLERLERED